MTQPDFIMMANKIGCKVAQATKVVVELRPYVQLSHNYKKKDLMTIKFLEDQVEFKIPDRSSLEEIYRMHLEKENIVQALRNLCEEKFEKV